LKGIINHKTLTAIAAISAIAVVLTAGSHMAYAFRGGFPGTSITKTIDNQGINAQTDTNETQDCLTAGANSGIAHSCTESSTNTNTESGGMLHK